MIAFGPVPSRRLGRSLGIDHVARKTRTYSCVYCQVGRTTRLRARRCAFLEPEVVRAAVAAKMELAARAGERIDYLTLVPEGEPTLDASLGSLIESLRGFGRPIAVVTNGSLLHDEAVRRDLARADWVSLKVDTVRENCWRQLNRPHRRLRLPAILEAMQRFAAGFCGRLVTETMLVAGVNEAEADVRLTAAFISTLNPSLAYLAVPTRPPAEPAIQPADRRA